MGDEEIYQYLTSLPDRMSLDHTSLLVSELPEFLTLLGYPDEMIFFEFLFSLSKRIIADAIVATERMNPPFLIVEVKTAMPMLRHPEENWSKVKNRFGEFLVSPTRRLLLFSPVCIGVYGPSIDKLYRLDQLTCDAVAEIRGFLRMPHGHNEFFREAAGASASEVGEHV